MTISPKDLDEQDPLSQFTKKFLLPKNQIYLCGHSLGPQPTEVAKDLSTLLDKWQNQAVDGHFKDPEPWIHYHELLLPHLAAMTNSFIDEVIPMNSLTTNIHLLLCSFYSPNPKRYKILVEPGLFPSDYHAVISQIKFHHMPQDSLIFLPANAKTNIIDENEVIEFIERNGEEIAVVLLPGIQYLTGQIFPIEKITKSAKAMGCKVGWDLAHAFANIPLDLHSWNVDFAAWCHYKYGNSGPGAVAGAFVHRAQINSNLPRLAGWWGENPKSRFEMHLSSDPIPSAAKWQLSNPPILALAPVLTSMRYFAQAGYMQPLREKSLALTNYMLHLIEKKIGNAVDIITPIGSRGSQISLRLSSQFPNINTSELYTKLRKNNIVVDFRKPDTIRVAAAPLYNSFRDINVFVEKLAEIIFET